MELDPPPRLVDHLDRLRREWNDPALHEERVALDEEAYERHREACYDDGTFIYAGALVTRSGELLLVQPEWAEGWIQPGGTHEPGETPEETARREVREETGIEVELTGVWRTNLLAESDGNRPPLWTLGVTFEATPVGGDLRPEPGEIDDVGWFETLPDRMVAAEVEVPERFQ